MRGSCYHALELLESHERFRDIESRGREEEGLATWVTRRSILYKAGT